MTRWPWHRQPNASEDAHAALREARRAHTDADNLGDRVDRVTESIARTVERNHFGAAIERAIRGS